MNIIISFITYTIIYGTDEKEKGRGVGENLGDPRVKTHHEKIHVVHRAEIMDLMSSGEKSSCKEH